jgi:hypothetical protein
VATAFALHFSMGGADLPASSGFLYGTVFLAFARLYPDFVLQIFFVLPVKVKWLALLQWIGYAVGFLFGTWMMRAMIAASVANSTILRRHLGECGTGTGGCSSGPRYVAADRAQAPVGPRPAI